MHGRDGLDRECVVRPSAASSELELLPRARRRQTVSVSAVLRLDEPHLSFSTFRSQKSVLNVEEQNSARGVQTY